MKADCKSVRREIDNADLGAQPKGHVQVHLASCEACSTFYQQEIKLRKLVGGLGTVEAPADFDFRLRARLAGEKPAARGMVFGGLSFGLRSVAMATLVMLLGAAFLFRVILNQPAPEVANTANPSVVQPAENATAPKSNTTDQTQENQTIKGASTVVTAQPKPMVQRSPARTAVAVNRGTVSKDLSSAPAEVVQHSSAATDPATEFPIDAPSDSIKLSLDDLNGVSRTISLPRVSFGSQRFVAGDTSNVVKANAKGVW